MNATNTVEIEKVQDRISELKVEKSKVWKEVYNHRKIGWRDAAWFEKHDELDKKITDLMEEISDLGLLEFELMCG